MNIAWDRKGLDNKNTVGDWKELENMNKALVKS